jgi:hypothetical protein
VTESTGLKSKHHKLGSTRAMCFSPPQGQWCAEIHNFLQDRRALRLEIFTRLIWQLASRRFTASGLCFFPGGSRFSPLFCSNLNAFFQQAFYYVRGARALLKLSWVLGAWFSTAKQHRCRRKGQRGAFCNPLYARPCSHKNRENER